MNLLKSIDGEALHTAMRNALKIQQKFAKITASHPQEKSLINMSKIDPRDIADLAIMLNYERKFAGTGEEMSDEEFETESVKIINAFAHNDRNAIFAYLDRWMAFVANYNPPEHIKTVDEALENFIYLRAQQSLGVTKMYEYPDYVASRYPDEKSLAKLQKMQSEVTLQEHNSNPLYHEHGVIAQFETIQKYDNADAEEMKRIKTEGQIYASLKPEWDPHLQFAEHLLNELEKTDDVVGTEQAGIAKVTLPEWLGPKKIDDFHTTIRSVVGATQTGFGLILKYEKLGTMRDLGLYKLFFIDGVNVFDNLPEPKKLEDAQRTVVNALINQTGVVTMAQPFEINGKFSYRVDVLDVRNGNDKPEYVAKMQTYGNEEARKELYKTVEKSLTPYLENIRELANQDFTEDMKKRAEDNRQQPPKSAVDVRDKNFGSAFFILDNIRDAFSKYATDQLPLYDLSGIDVRDFNDIALVTRLAKTLGVGDRDLSDAEYKTEIANMIKAFGTHDHTAMKPYLDRMYSFIENYKLPSTIESTNDILRAVTYLRLQQTSTVKSEENPWYIEEKYPTAVDKARYSAFEQSYYIEYQRVDFALKLSTGVNFGTSTKRYSEVFATYKADMKADNPANDPYLTREELAYTQTTRHYTTERQAMLATADTADKSYIFKTVLPDEAMAMSGAVADEGEFTESAKVFYRGFLANIYPSDFSDTTVLKRYGFTNSFGEDALRLMFIDGKSVYDSVFAKGEKFSLDSLYRGYKMIFSAMINQTGLVQIAHLQEENGELKVELNTLDVSSNGKFKSEYASKLAEFESNTQVRYDAIKEHITTACIESKRALDAEKERIEKEKEARKAEGRKQETERYLDEQKGFEDDLLNLGDVFQTRDFDVDGVIEKNGVDKNQSRVFAFNRSVILQGMLHEIANFTNCEIEVNEFLNRLAMTFDGQDFDKESYNNAWRELWKQAIEGLNSNADSIDYEKSVPYSYTTSMVERFMKGALKLYGHENADVDLFGGMTLDEMTGYIVENVPTWEEKHQNDYFSKLSPKQLLDMPTVEEQFALWKKTPLQSYRNLTGVKVDKKYLNENNHFNAEGKKWVSDKLISFYDRINLIANALDGSTLEHTDEETLRREMHEFAEQIKGVILSIKVYNEEQINERTGNKLPVEKDLEKFRTNIGRMIEVEEQLKTEHREAYQRGEERQWNNLAGSEMALGENENRPERQIGIFDEVLLEERKEASQARKAEAQARQEKENTIRHAIVLNFTTFKNGRYSKPKNDPASAFSIAVDSQYSHIDDMIFARPRRVRNYERLNKADVNVSIELEGEQKNLADEFAYKTGVKINPDQLQFVLSNFIEQNKSSNGLSVDTNALGLQYRLLTADLYLVALNNLNRRAVKNGETITADQMTETYDMLNKMMKNSAKACAYPENLPNGELTKEERFNFRNNFTERLVPKDSRQMAMRTMQATTKGFDFGKSGWNTAMGYTEFLNVINNAKSRLNDNELQTPEGQKKVAQMYEAMVHYNNSRTGWSKFVNFRKNRKELEAIARFKEIALAKSGLTEREFNEKTAVTENEGWTKLKNDISTAKLAENNEARQNEQQAQRQNEVNRQVERLNVREAENKKVEKREQVKKEEEHRIEVQNNAPKK